jgi:hypothetical protein
MDKDAEIAAMSAVAKALEPLDEIVRQRVISWAASRFGSQLPTSSQLSRGCRQPALNHQPF